MRTLCLDEVDSTLLEAERLIAGGLTEPTVICARSQTEGVGRFGRRWASPPGNLYWTVALRREAHWPSDTGLLPLVAGLAAFDVLLRTGLDEGRLLLKWPNDVLVDGRKIAGTLARRVLDKSASPAPVFLLIGLGINVMSFPEDAVFPATSLAVCGDVVLNLQALRDDLSEAFQHRFTQWRCGHHSLLRELYQRRLFGAGETIRVSTDRDRTHVVEGRSLGITPEGALLLRTGDGCEHVFHLDEGVR